MESIKEKESTLQIPQSVAADLRNIAGKHGQKVKTITRLVLKNFVLEHQKNPTVLTKLLTDPKLQAVNS